MGTWDNFKAERRVSMDDIAQTIHDSVSMEDVLGAYCPGIPRKHHRCPCPIHNGRDYNFSYTEHGYKCFVCGASGDVVGFVKEVLGYRTRPDAMKRISADFNLGLDLGADITPEISAKVQEARARAQKRSEEIKAWSNNYDALMDEWCTLDRLIRLTDDPVKQAKAMERIVEVQYELDSMPPEPR